LQGTLLPNKKSNIKEEGEKMKENNETQKLTGIVCLTILGIITLLGIFWGKNGLIGLGIGVMVILFGGILSLTKG